MIPRSSNAQTLAQDLSATILSASTALQISSAVAAADSFLRRHSSDQLRRSFFSLAFPSLLLRLFGFDSSSSSSSSSWIDQSSSNPDLAAKIFDLLSPNGILILSIKSIDRLKIVKFIFPAERLPEWIRFVLLRSENTNLDFFPLLKSRVKEKQIQLNCFEYYLFWFAYYPVCKGNSENAEGGVVRKSRRFRLEQWTSSIIRSNRKAGEKTEYDLYLGLLYAYMNAFVPKCGLGLSQPYRSSLVYYSSSWDGDAFELAEFFIYTLVHFWMVDNDFSPLPMSVCQSVGLVFPFRPVLGETPPTPGLGEVLKLLVKYLNCGLIASNEGDVRDRIVYVESPAKKFSGSGASVVLENHVGSWNLIIQRPMYRFILRSFLFYPMGASIKNISQVFSLWVTYLTPWLTNSEDFAQFEMPMSQKSDSLRKEDYSSERKNKDDKRKREELMYTPVWESYVASNYLFYSSLVVHFLGFAHKVLHTNVEAVVQMVLKVLNILTSSKELMDFLCKVDTAYHSKQSGPFSSYVDNVHKYIPSIREQLQDWEDGLCESDADGSFLHENWNRDLRLFSDGEDGASKLLQLFILRAEHEIRAIPSDHQDLDSIKYKMASLFGGSIIPSSTPNPIAEPLNLQNDREVFTPKHPGVGKRTWADVKYKGDWMRRPISDNEVAWVATLLIRLSDWLNEVLGLDRVDNTDSTDPTYVVDIPRERGYIGGPKEAFDVFISLVGSWLRVVVQSVVRFMRGHGMRINLRVLASKKFVMVLVAYVFACVLKKAFWTTAALSISA